MNPVKVGIIGVETSLMHISMPPKIFRSWTLLVVQTYGPRERRQRQNNGDCKLNRLIPCFKMIQLKSY